jgi:membrane-associated phospholipid phosphatase
LACYVHRLSFFRRRFTCSCRPAAIAVCIAGIFLGHSARADEPAAPGVTASFSPGRRPGSIFSLDELRLLGDDTKSILTSPVRWDRQDWLEAGILTASIVGSSSLDHGTRIIAQRNRTRSLDTFSKQFEKLGAEYSFVVLAGFEVTSLLDDDDVRARAVVVDGLSSSLIASGIITPVLKYSVGRVRSNSTFATYQFKPFSSNASFPSGHATQAFAVASVIAADYPEWWVQVVAYGAAGVVGLARIEQNAHFMSDVVAGAIIGTVVGRAVVARHNKAVQHGMTVAPLIDGRQVGLVCSYDF